jgi:spore germination protein YaaH
MLIPKKIKIITLIILSIVLSLLGILWFFWEIPLLSPLSENSSFRFIDQILNKEKKKSGKIVYGFLPYWNLSKITIQPEITHLAYFSLTIGPDGFIVTSQEDYLEPGYNKLDSEELSNIANFVTQNQGKVDLVLSQFDNEDIEHLISNQTAQQNLLLSLDSLILSMPISGINLDIEYTGEVDQKTRDNFTQLIITVRQHLQSKFKHIKLSIDMYASAANRPLIWDIEKIAPYVDYIIVMAYDYHRASSSQAGPVAPLFGSKKYWEYDINTHIKAFSKMVPKEKILLGIPFYGYEWQTDSREPQANSYPKTGATASYKRVEELLERSKTEDLKLEEHWDETALSPYLVYEEDDEIYMIYYENKKSINYKIDYVKQLDLAGVAIWALGYEGEDRDLWEVIEKL